MALSVRMDPLLEREREVAAKRRGITKSQFIGEAVQRAAGMKDPYALTQQLKSDEERLHPGVSKAFDGVERPYDSAGSRWQLLGRLRKKHGVGGDR